MENNKEFSLREIDLNAIARKIMKRKKLFIINLSITFVVSCAIIFSVPRTYTCSVKLAPESTNSSMGSLGSLASTFGLNMGNLTSQDAIIPEFPARAMGPPGNFLLTRGAGEIFERIWVL